MTTLPSSPRPGPRCGSPRPYHGCSNEQDSTPRRHPGQQPVPRPPCRQPPPQGEQGPGSPGSTDHHAVRRRDIDHATRRLSVEPCKPVPPPERLCPALHAHLTPLPHINCWRWRIAKKRNGVQSIGTSSPFAAASRTGDRFSDCGLPDSAYTGHDHEGPDYAQTEDVRATRETRHANEVLPRSRPIPCHVGSGGRSTQQIVAMARVAGARLIHFVRRTCRIEPCSSWREKSVG